MATGGRTRPGSAPTRSHASALGSGAALDGLPEHEQLRRGALRRKRTTSGGCPAPVAGSRADQAAVPCRRPVHASPGHGLPGGFSRLVRGALPVLGERTAAPARPAAERSTDCGTRATATVCGEGEAPPWFPGIGETTRAAVRAAREGTREVVGDRRPCAGGPQRLGDASTRRGNAGRTDGCRLAGGARPRARLQPRSARTDSRRGAATAEDAVRRS